MTTASPTGENPPKSRSVLFLSLALLVLAGVTIGVLALLVTIFQHKQEAREPFVRVVEVDELTTDPAQWGKNWPHQYDSYRRTVDTEETEYGGSSAMPQSNLETHPWLKRLYAGYAFSIDYREARGHAYMLYDQEVTERVTNARKAGPACIAMLRSFRPTAGWVWKPWANPPMRKRSPRISALMRS